MIENGAYYRGRVIGVRHVAVGQERKPALEFALELAEGQESCVKFLTPAAMKYTRERLEGLGCTASDLTGADWLKKINARVGGMVVNCKGEVYEGSGRIADIYPAGHPEVVGAGSPFGGGDDDDAPF